jgi:uncharacterized membrane protein YccF (DUF307 family)
MLRPLLLCLALLCGAHAVTRYVGSQPGDLPTINACNTLLGAGDICAIRTGTYRESWIVTKANTSFVAASSSDKPLIRGLDVVTSTWSSWTSPTGSQGWTTKLPPNFTSLSTLKATDLWLDDAVYVNGQLMPFARYPKLKSIDHATAMIAPRDYLMMDAVTVLNNTAFNMTSNDLAGFPSGYWAGAKITLGPGAFWALITCNIYDHIDNTLSVACQPGPAGQSNFAMTGTYRRYIVQAGNYFYLYGKRDNMETAGEWFLEKSPIDNSYQLYLMTPNACVPGAPDCVVEMKSTRYYAMNVTLINGLLLDGLTFYGTTITTYNPYHQYTYPNNITIRNCDFYYQWDFIEQMPSFDGNSPMVGAVAAQRYYGNNITIINNNFMYSAYHHLQIGGASQLISNNVFYRSAYTGCATYAVYVSFAFVRSAWDKGRNAMTHNTFAYGGADMTIIQPGVDMLYNDFYMSHMQRTDTGTIFCYGINGSGSVIAYNTMHDIYAQLNVTNNMQYFGAEPLYFDQGCGNILIYRNIIWNTGGSEAFAIFPTSLVRPQATNANISFVRNSIDSQVHLTSGNSINYSSTIHFAANLYQNIYNGNQTLFDSTKKGVTDVGNMYHTDYTDMESGDFTLRGSSSAIGAINPTTTFGNAYEYLTKYTANNPLVDSSDILPENLSEAGALDKNQRVFVTGAQLRSQDGFVVTYQSGIYKISQLPIGRKLSSDFILAAYPTSMNGMGSCTVETALEVQQAICTVTGSPVGNIIWYRLKGQWYNTTFITTGYEYSTVPAMKLTVINSDTQSRTDYPVRWSANTRKFIADGLLKDCSTLGFADSYGTVLDYWLDSKYCNSSDTPIWIKMIDLPALGNSTITVWFNSQYSSNNATRTFAYYSDLSDASSFGSYSNRPNTILVYGSNNITIIGKNNTSSSNKVTGFWFNNYNKIYLPQSYAVDIDINVLYSPPGFAIFMQAPRRYNSNTSYFGYHSCNPSACKTGFCSSVSPYVCTNWTDINQAQWVTKVQSSVGFQYLDVGQYQGYFIENGTVVSQMYFNNTCSWCLLNGQYQFGVPAGEFRVEFSNFRIRPFAFPEPTVIVVG